MNDDRLRVRCAYCGADWETWGTLADNGATFEPERPDGLRCPSCMMQAAHLVEVNGEEVDAARREA